MALRAQHFNTRFSRTRERVCTCSGNLKRKQTEQDRKNDLQTQNSCPCGLHFRQDANRQAHSVRPRAPRTVIDSSRHLNREAFEAWENFPSEWTVTLSSALRSGLDVQDVIAPKIFNTKDNIHDVTRSRQESNAKILSERIECACHRLKSKRARWAERQAKWRARVVVHRYDRAGSSPAWIPSLRASKRIWSKGLEVKRVCVNSVLQLPFYQGAHKVTISSSSSCHSCVMFQQPESY